MSEKSSSSRRVLIGDYDKVIAHTLGLIFLKAGFEVRTTTGGQEALEIGRTWRPGLAILDVLLEGASGFETGEALMKAVPECVLFFTFSSTAPSRVRPEFHIEYEEFAKPVRPEELLDAARRRLGPA